MRYISLAIFLFAFWLALSGHYTPVLVASGAACAVLCLLAGLRLRIVDTEGHPIELFVRAVTYIPWLANEVAKSAWAVTKIILHPRLPISPTLVRFRPLQRSVVGLVTHANSITLTPGTITIEATPGEFLVHGLTRASAEGAVDSDMDRRLAALEQR